MSALSPCNRKRASTRKRIMDRARSCSKIIHIISPGTGFDQLRQELGPYKIDDKIDMDMMSSSQSYDEYWGEVAKLMDKSGDDDSDPWCVYEILPRFAHATLAVSVNSVQSDVHRDIKRTRMSHETLDSHLQIRFGVETKSATDKCDSCTKCKEKCAGNR